MLRAKVLSFLAWLFITLWSLTIRMRFVNHDIPDRLRNNGKNFLYAFWHGRLFLLFYHYRNRGIMIPASESRDGDVIARLLKRFCYDVVRGSSKRRGERALLGLIDGLRKGKIVAIAVDGPRGPLHEVKQGVMYLAGKLNKPIIPGASSASRYWILKRTWEKLLVPAPFSKGVVVLGEPIIVNGTSEDELEAKRKELEAALHKVSREADEYFRKQTTENRG